MDLWFILQLIIIWPGCGGVELMYPYGASENDSMAQACNDVFDVLPLTTPFKFHSIRHNQVYINTNGILSLRSEFTSPIPEMFPLATPDALIALFWADHDLTIGGNIWFRESEDPDLRQRGAEDVQRHFSACADGFYPGKVSVITWENVAYQGADPFVCDAFCQCMKDHDDVTYCSCLHVDGQSEDYCKCIVAYNDTELCNCLVADNCPIFCECTKFYNEEFCECVFLEGGEHPIEFCNCLKDRDRDYCTCYIGHQNEEFCDCLANYDYMSDNNTCECMILDNNSHTFCECMMYYNDEELCLCYEQTLSTVFCHCIKEGKEADFCRCVAFEEYDYGFCECLAANTDDSLFCECMDKYGDEEFCRCFSSVKDYYVCSCFLVYNDYEFCECFVIFYDQDFCDCVGLGADDDDCKCRFLNQFSDNFCDCMQRYEDIDWCQCYDQYGHEAFCDCFVLHQNETFCNCSITFNDDSFCDCIVKYNDEDFCHCLSEYDDFDFCDCLNQGRDLDFCLCYRSVYDEDFCECNATTDDYAFCECHYFYSYSSEFCGCMSVYDDYDFCFCYDDHLNDTFCDCFVMYGEDDFCHCMVQYNNSDFCNCMTAIRNDTDFCTCYSVANNDYDFCECKFYYDYEYSFCDCIQTYEAYDDFYYDAFDFCGCLANHSGNVDFCNCYIEYNNESLCSCVAEGNTAKFCECYIAHGNEDFCTCFSERLDFNFCDCYQDYFDENLCNCYAKFLNIDVCQCIEQLEGYTDAYFCYCLFLKNDVDYCKCFVNHFNCTLCECYMVTHDYGLCGHIEDDSMRELTEGTNDSKMVDVHEAMQRRDTWLKKDKFNPRQNIDDINVVKKGFRPVKRSHYERIMTGNTNRKITKTDKQQEVDNTQKYDRQDEVQHGLTKSRPATIEEWQGKKAAGRMMRDAELTVGIKKVRASDKQIKSKISDSPIITNKQLLGLHADGKELEGHRNKRIAMQDGQKFEEDFEQHKQKLALAREEKQQMSKNNERLQLQQGKKRETRKITNKSEQKKMIKENENKKDTKNISQNLFPISQQTEKSGTLLVNTYQVVLLTNGKLAFVMFNYKSINWLTGNTGGGVDGQGGTMASVGINKGNEILGYNHASSMTSDLYSLVTDSNTGIPGQWMYLVSKKRKVFGPECQILAP